MKPELIRADIRRIVSRITVNVKWNEVIHCLGSHDNQFQEFHHKGL